MRNLDHIENEDDWEILTGFLPEGWEEKAKDLGALKRCRKFADSGVMLRTLLIHLADGCSMRETVTRARLAGLVNASDVALFKRLKHSGEWFRWMAEGVMKDWLAKQPEVVFGENLRVRLIDGTTVQEPGATGSTWRIHYAIRLPELTCDEVHVTTPKLGESLARFTFCAGELAVGDRAYSTRSGIAHVHGSGADVLVRMNAKNLPLIDQTGATWDLLAHLRTLSARRVGDWDVSVSYRNALIPGRVCAVKKDKVATEKAIKKLRRIASKNGRSLQPETIESAGYVFVFTTLPRRRFSPTKTLEIYRGRWQIELVFKRLKSLMSLGRLRRKDLDAAQAWLHGKLLVAFLIEAMIAAGESFFPWGYPLKEEPMHLA
jgi:hypothetical protein